MGPQAIYVVSGEDDGGSFVSESELSDDNASWETVEENEMADLDAVDAVILYPQYFTIIQSIFLSFFFDYLVFDF